MGVAGGHRPGLGAGAGADDRRLSHRGDDAAGPFEYSGIVWTTALGAFIWAKPDVGFRRAVLVGAGLYIWHREVRWGSGADRAPARPAAAPERAATRKPMSPKLRRRQQQPRAGVGEEIDLARPERPGRRQVAEQAARNSGPAGSSAPAAFRIRAAA